MAIRFHSFTTTSEQKKWLLSILSFTRLSMLWCPRKREILYSEEHIAYHTFPSMERQPRKEKGRAAKLQNSPFRLFFMSFPIHIFFPLVCFPWIYPVLKLGLFFFLSDVWLLKRKKLELLWEGCLLWFVAAEKTWHQDTGEFVLPFPIDWAAALLLECVTNIRNSWQSGIDCCLFSSLPPVPFLLALLFKVTAVISYVAAWCCCLIYHTISFSPSLWSGNIVFNKTCCF